MRDPPPHAIMNDRPHALRAGGCCDLFSCAIIARTRKLRHDALIENPAANKFA
ncbi:hypothetical protein [Bradyrhizobium zhanjiangense]|uniref:hypothetical protein n=1 Tax=Bradyrhizobium zhanjiangense TaxID=1325107 RepID=UPI0013E8D9D6|nr:hypothetical protein [Bradyrhizobium zhanjiangense]